MSAGFDGTVRVWRNFFLTDDEVGGALPSGTLIEDSVNLRLQAFKSDQVSMAPGLESLKVFQATSRNKNIREGDELEVVAPHNHPYYGKFLHVDDITLSNFHPSDARSYLILIVSHSEIAHAKF